MSSFRSKLLLCLLLLVTASSGCVLFLSSRNANRIAFELIQEKVLSVAVSAAPRIDGGALSALRKPDQDGSEGYIQIRDQLREIRDANRGGDLSIQFIYIMRPVENGEWIYVVDAEEEGEDKSYLGDPVEFEKESEKPPLNEPRVDDAFATDSFGTWLSAFAPVRNSDGEPVAVVGVDVDAKQVSSKLNQLTVGGLVALAISLSLATALALWLSGMVSAPLTRLKQTVDQIGEGDLAVRADEDELPDDEIGVLGRAINEMADGLEERESLKGALVHYVRSQAADSKLLSDDEQETEEVLRSVTVFVAELRGFSRLASSLGSDRVFSLLNHYFSSMIDIVLRHRGALEQTSNDTVVAVFGSNTPDSHQRRHAVETAIEMRSALEQIQQEWKVKENDRISLHVGIHSGEVPFSGEEKHREIVAGSLTELQEIAGKLMSHESGGKGHSLHISQAASKRIRQVFPMDNVGTSGEQAVYEVNFPGAVS